MTLIFCVDDDGGMMFNHRRQSRDKAVIDDIVALSKGNMIYMSEYSAPLFDVMNIYAGADFLSQGKNGICFVENASMSEYNSSANTVIVYKWNRRYPSDFKPDINGDDFGRCLKSSFDFIGDSHEKITKEVYSK